MTETTNIKDTCDIYIVRKDGSVTTTRTNGGNKK